MNGYAETTSVSDPADAPPPDAVPVPVEHAGFGRRLLARLIDAPIVVVCGGIVSAMLAGVIGVFVELYFKIWPGAATADENEETAKLVMGLLVYAFGLVFGWLYYTVMESSKWQATLGKKTLGIVVTDMEGKRISFARANGRYWAKALSWATFFVGYILVAITDKKQGLHDIIAGCLIDCGRID